MATSLKFVMGDIFVRQSAGAGLNSYGETYDCFLPHFGGCRGFGSRGLSNVARVLRIRALPGRAFQRRIRAAGLPGADGRGERVEEKTECGKRAV